MGRTEELDRALALAYKYLNRSERSVCQTRARLEEADFEHQTIEAAIEILVDQGAVDDARLARAYTHDKRELEQWGSERIRRGLIERGIDAEVIEEALARADNQRALGDHQRAPEERERTPEDGELGRAVAVLEKRLRSAPRDRRERDRALGMLLRKGYDSEIALQALGRFARPAARYYDPVSD